jgi:UDPglucose 6-dehydrogenase
MGTETKIGIVGLWHLGCVLSAAWSKLGFSVTAFDHDKSLIENLNRDRSPIFEPKLKQTLREGRNNGQLTFTSDMKSLADRDFVFLAFDTPVLEDDTSDLTILFNAVQELGAVLKDNAVVIVSSQSPVGTCRKFLAILQEHNESLEVAYSPENLRLGEAIECYLNPGRIIIGAESETAMSKAVSLFSNISAELVTMNLSSSEMVKHAINSFLANSIVFANHLADLCEVSGANILEVVSAAKSDPRIGPRAYLSAGIGFSGGTLGRDLKVLAELNKSSGKGAFLYESLLDFNNERKNVIVEKVIALLGDGLSGKTIAVLGVTYKPETSTLRRSIPLEIVRLLGQKNARLKVYDPKANYDELSESPSFEICESISDAIAQSDLIVLLTEWGEFRQYDWKAGAKLVRNRKFLDAKNALCDLKLDEMGFSYAGIGLAAC